MQKSGWSRLMVFESSCYDRTIYLIEFFLIFIRIFTKIKRNDNPFALVSILISKIKSIAA